MSFVELLTCAMAATEEMVERLTSLEFREAGDIARRKENPVLRLANTKLLHRPHYNYVKLKTTLNDTL